MFYRGRKRFHLFTSHPSQNTVYFHSLFNQVTARWDASNLARETCICVTVKASPWTKITDGVALISGGGTEQLMEIPLFPQRRAKLPLDDCCLISDGFYRWSQPPIWVWTCDCESRILTTTLDDCCLILDGFYRSSQPPTWVWTCDCEFAYSDHDTTWRRITYL